MFKVLISDNLGERGVQIFQEADNIEVDVKTGLSPDELKKIIGDYDALVIRSATKVTADIIEAGKKLKVVGRAGIGLDNVDLKAATKRGIIVMNTPGGNVVTTAEHAISMMLALTRNIPQGTATMKAGIWEKKKLMGREIRDKKLGLVGFGKIGSIVAELGRGLKMNVLVHDPNINPERIEQAGFQFVTLDELYRQSDYITIHVPKLKTTLGMINKEAFDKMKEGVMIINCARGGIINEADLCDAIKSGKVAGAALDVFETEPPGVTPLVQLDKVVTTPHLGASTVEAQTNVAVAIAGQIVEYFQTGTIINAANTPSVTGELLVKLKPYLSLADRMGCLAAQLIQGPTKEVIIEYSGDFQNLDLTPVSTSIINGLLKPIMKDEVNPVNAPVIAKERGITVTETTSAESQDYNNLITLKVKTSDEKLSSISGTIFGKKDPRVVAINNFRIEMVPEGHLALIHNLDKPGAIGSIGVTLGDNGINIAKMHVGQEQGGEKNIILLRTDTQIPDNVLEKLKALPMVKSITPLEL
ncbi:MAG: phosphoglycerate dehydrogenase [Desulfobacterales bacterium]|nr:phosphoglycerate dehydrogenase [Desulfobacterales bacterium]